MQALRICIVAVFAAATLAASSSVKAKKIHKTPRLQRRLGLARIELPEPRLKHLAHRLLEVKRGFLSAQVTANDGHLVGLSVKMKHGHKPGYHVSVGQGYGKKGWHVPPDLGHADHTSFSSGPYSGDSFQSLFRGSEGLSFGDASSSLFSGGQPYYYKDTASLSSLYPFTGYQVPSYVAASPKFPVTKLVDSVPSMLSAVSGVYDQASLVALGGHASADLHALKLGTNLPATRVVHKVPLSVLPKKATYVQQFPATLHGVHAKLVSPAVVQPYASAKLNYPGGGHHVLSLQKVPVSKLAAHVPQSHYVMHTVKPVSSAIGVIKTPIYAATGSGELYPVDVDGGALQEDYVVGGDGFQSGYGGVGGQASAGYGNGGVERPQYGGIQGGQSNGGGVGKYSQGSGEAGGVDNGGFQGGQFNGDGGGKYGHGNGAAGGTENSGHQGGQFSGGGGGKYGHGNGAAGGTDNGGFQGGQLNGGGGGKYGHGNGAAGGADNGGFQGGQFNSGGGGKYGQGNGAAGGADNGGFQGGQFNGGGGGKYGHGNGAAGGFDNGGFEGGQFSGGGGDKYGHGNGAAGGFGDGGFNGGGGSKYAHGNSAERGLSKGGFQGGGGGKYGPESGASGGFGNGGLQDGQLNGGGGKYGQGNGFQQGFGNSGEGLQDSYPNKKGHGGTAGYVNGGGPQAFPSGLGYPGNGNGGGLSHKNYGNAGAGPQAGFSHGGHQGGNGFAGGAQSGYVSGGGAANGFANGGFQGPHPGGGGPQQHAFPHGVTGFNGVPGSLSPKNGLKGALPAELAYGGLSGGGLQVPVVQAHHFPDIPGPEESIARGQFNGNARGHVIGRANSGGAAEEGELQGRASGEGFSSVTQASGDYKSPQGALPGYDVKGEGAAGGPSRFLGKENGEAGYKSGGGWKPIVDSRYEAKLNGGSLNVGKLDGNQQRSSFGGNGLTKLYGGTPANGNTFINAAGDGLVNGDLQGKGSHVQYPKYRQNGEKFFGSGNFQANRGKERFFGGSGNGHFRQVNMNGNGGLYQNSGSGENGDTPAHVPSKEFNGRESNARLNNDFGNGGGFHGGAQGPGYFGANGNSGLHTQAKFHNGGSEGQTVFDQSEGIQGNGGSGVGEFSQESERGRPRFRGSGNGRNFGQADPNDQFGGGSNGGGPTPPKFCPKGGWKPIIKNGKRNMKGEEGAMRRIPGGQGNGFYGQNGFEAPGQYGDGAMGYAEVNRFEGGEVYQGQAPREDSGGSGGFNRGPVNQFNGGGSLGMQGKAGNGGPEAGYSNGRMNGFPSESPFGPQSQLSNGGSQNVRYGNGQGATYGGAPRQFLHGRVNGAGFSQAGADYEGEELPGEESFKREQVKKVVFRPSSTQIKKVPKSALISGRAAFSRGNKKSASLKRTSVKDNPSVGPSQLTTVKEPPNLEQLLATYKIDSQNLLPLELRSLRGHGYSDVSLEDNASAPTFQKTIPAGQLELVTPAGGVTSVKAHSTGGLKQTVSVDPLGSLSSAEQSSEEQEKESTPQPVPESLPNTQGILAVKDLSVSVPSGGKSESSAGAPPATLEGSSSEEIVEPREKASPADTLRGSLEKSSLYDTHEGHGLPYGHRRSSTYYKQDRISSSYLIPVRVPPSLRSKTKRSG